MRIFWIFVCLLCLSGCAIKPTDLGFNHQHWDQLGKIKQQQLIEQYKQTQKSSFNLGQPVAGSAIEVRVSNGQMMMPPFLDYNDYQPVSFVLFENQCKKTKVLSLTGKQKINLSACYYENILSLDGSEYDMKKRMGTLFIHSSPSVEKGFYLLWIVQRRLCSFEAGQYLH